MTLEILQKEMILAMKEKNKIKKQVFADVIATSKNMAIEKKQKDNVTEDIIMSSIKKVYKIAKEQLESCPEAREDLRVEYKEYLEHVEKLMPKQMSKSEIEHEVDLVLNDLNGAFNKGMIMKQLMPKLKGKADGKLINQIVEEKLKNIH